MIINEEGVDTSQFLEATEGVIKLFDLLGNAAFTIVQNDMSANVKVSTSGVRPGWRAHISSESRRWDAEEGWEAMLLIAGPSPNLSPYRK